MQAARAGLDVGAKRAINGTCANISFAFGGALSGFTVLIQCAATTHVEATSVQIYQIVATACNRAACPAAADATYVERQLRGVVSSTGP